MFVGESASFLPVNNNCSNQFAILKHRYRKHGAKAGELHHGDEPRLAFNIALLGGDVGNVNHALRSAEATKRAARFGANQGGTSSSLSKRRWHVVHCDGAKCVAFAK